MDTNQMIETKKAKKLAKKLKKLSSRDDRGIQTLFRTLSKNHFTLLEMVDRKANIILSVNSIIISLTLGGLILNGVNNEFRIDMIHAPIMIVFSVISMIYAVVAISPNNTPWRRERLRKGILFHGDFSRQPLEDYTSKITKLLENGSQLYNAMTEDIYYLGRQVMQKEKFIKQSLNSFILGLVLSTLAYLIVQFY